MKRKKQSRGNCSKKYTQVQNPMGEGKNNTRRQYWCRVLSGKGVSEDASFSFDEFLPDFTVFQSAHASHVRLGNREQRRVTGVESSMRGKIKLVVVARRRAVNCYPSRGQ